MIAILCVNIDAGCFGAKKGNEIIRECLSYYKNRQFIKGDGSFDTIPLPQIMIKFVNNHTDVKPFTKDYFTCKSFTTGLISTTNNSYSIHHFAGSWLSDDEKEVSELCQKIHSKIKIKPVEKIVCIFAGVIRRIHKYGLKAAILHWTKRGNK